MPKTTKKRAAWGSKKRAAEDAAAEAQASADAAAAENGHAAAATKPGVGEAIDSIKGWLAPFDASERKQILKAVGVFLR